MEFTYENQGTNTYLCCDLTNMEIDTMGLGMITNNRIQGFVPSIFTQMDGRKFIKYNVSAKVSMKQLFSGPVNRKRLVNVFSGIVDVLILSEEYMLDINSIILDEDYIFINVSDYSAEVICVPAVMENNGNMEAALFFKNIMFTTQFDSSENCDYVAEIINFLNQKGTFSILQLKKLLDNLKRQEVSTAGYRDVQSPVNKVAEAVEVPVPKVEQPILEPKAVADVKKESPMSKQSAEPNNNSFGAIPSRQKDIEPSIAQTPEKEISLFYLLQHYNKENADAYKAQKEVKKQKTDEATGKAAKEKKIKKEKPKKEKQKEKPDSRLVTYAVPGQQKMPSASSQPAVSAPFPVQQTTPSPVAAPEKQSTAAPISPPEIQTVNLPSDNFGETEYMNPDDGGTILMGMDCTVTQPYLIRLKNNERIPVDGDIFRIGRSREKMDYAIPENKFVGHNHCHILFRNGEFYIVDDNSKNHTYVNGTMIQSGVETKLSHGMIISVANEEFEFNLF